MFLKAIFKTGLFFLLIVSCVSKAPLNVQKSFTQQFENAQDISWVKKNNNDWEVSFYQKKFHYKTVAYNANGKWVSTSVEVSDYDVPNEFLTLLKTQFPESFLIKIFKKHTQTENHYEFEIEDEGQLYVLGFASNNELMILENETSRLRNEIIIEND